MTQQQHTIKIERIFVDKKQQRDEKHKSKSPKVSQKRMTANLNRPVAGRAPAANRRACGVK